MHHERACRAAALGRPPDVGACVGSRPEGSGGDALMSPARPGGVTTGVGADGDRRVPPPSPTPRVAGPRRCTPERDHHPRGDRPVRPPTTRSGTGGCAGRSLSCRSAHPTLHRCHTRRPVRRHREAVRAPRATVRGTAACVLQLRVHRASRPAAVNHRGVWRRSSPAVLSSQTEDSGPVSPRPTMPGRSRWWSGAADSTGGGGVRGRGPCADSSPRMSGCRSAHSWRGAGSSPLSARGRTAT